MLLEMEKLHQSPGINHSCISLLVCLARVWGGSAQKRFRNGLYEKLLLKTVIAAKIVGSLRTYILGSAQEEELAFDTRERNGI